METRISVGAAFQPRMTLPSRLESRAYHGLISQERFRKRCYSTLTRITLVCQRSTKRELGNKQKRELGNKQKRELGNKQKREFWKEQAGTVT